MGVSIDSGGGGKSGRKASSADLNLVPYIDLLTCMVAFLLITAVWSHLARLEVRQHGAGASSEAEQTPETRLAIVVGEEGFNVVAGTDRQAVPRKGADYDFPALLAELRKLKERFPDKPDIEVAAEDGIRYEVLAQTLDTTLEARFPDVSLRDAASSGM